MALALDQHDTQFPAPPTRFTSFEDAVDRLLPYHVWQIPDEDLLPEPDPEEGASRQLYTSDRQSSQRPVNSSTVSWTSGTDSRLRAGARAT